MDIAPSLLWQPNQRVSVSLKYESFRKEETPQLMQKPGYNTQAGVVPTLSDPNLSGVDVPGLSDDWNSMSYADFRRSVTSGLSAWLDLKVDDHWNLRAGYSHQAYQVDAVFSGNLGMANNHTFLQGRRFRRQVYTNNDDTGEIQAIGTHRVGGASLRMLFGAQYVDRRFEARAGQAPNDLALGSDPTASPLPLWDLRDPSTWNRVVTIPLGALTVNPFDQTTQFLDRSIYGGATLGLFNDRMYVLAGWRRTATENQVTNHVTGLAQAKLTQTAITPQYGLLYKCTPGISLFATYAESFVPGSQILVSPDGSKSPAAPTKGHGYDAGLKAHLFGGRLSGTLTFFDIRNRNIVNDLASTNSDGITFIFNVQSGEQRSYGFELDATARMVKNWQIYVSFSSMTARITEFSGRDAAILAQNPFTLDVAGQANYKNVVRFHNAPLQMSAPRIANLWTRYDFTQAGLDGFYLAGGVNWVFDQTLLPDTPAFARQTYALVNATLGYTWKWRGRRMDTALTGKNLTDEHYRPSQSSRSRPREILLTLRVRI